jgi:two-component system CheB/CheR fusion protein
MDASLVMDDESAAQRTIHIHAYPQSPSRDAEVVESVVLVIRDLSAQGDDAETSEAVDAQMRRIETGGAPDDPQSTGEAALRQEEIERLQEQVRRLMAANRDLSEANNILTRANLDLRQSNEEFLVTTEELQTASEEVETLNEELQASNEELETLNEELQATVEELNTSNDDLEARSQELQRLATHLETQRRTSETERVRLNAILTSMSDAALVLDATGAPVQTNAAYERMFGGERDALAPEDERGRSLALKDTLQQRTVRGESYSMEFTQLSAHGGRRWFEANGQPIITGDVVVGGVIVIRDITDRSLRRLQNEFLAQAAHELRTPLTSTQAALQLLLQRGSRMTPEGSQRNLAIALAQVRRLGSLVSDLVDVARLQNGKLNLQFTTVNVADVVRKAVDTLRLSVAQRIDLVIEDEPLMARADPLRLEQVIDNLLTNAAKYAPKSQHIDVQVRRSDGHAEVSVRDEGPGIAEKEASQLFSRFYQVPRQDGATHGGLGLGLYIVRELVVAHDGDVSINTTPGIGSTFTVRLPLIAE